VLAGHATDDVAEGVDDGGADHRPVRRERHVLPGAHRRRLLEDGVEGVDASVPDFTTRAQSAIASRIFSSMPNAA
jgi:hypothetical protein